MKIICTLKEKNIICHHFALPDVYCVLCEMLCKNSFPVKANFMHPISEFTDEEKMCAYHKCITCLEKEIEWEITDDQKDNTQADSQRENKLIQLKCPSGLYKILLHHLKTVDIYKDGHYIPLVSEIEWQNVECENSDF